MPLPARGAVRSAHGCKPAQIQDSVSPVTLSLRGLGGPIPSRGRGWCLWGHTHGRESWGSLDTDCHGCQCPPNRLQAVVWTRPLTFMGRGC